MVEQDNGVAQMGWKKIGDAFEILNGRVRRPGSRVKASLDASQWAARGQGGSTESYPGTVPGG